nr:hypothetical protein [Mobiluncus sp. Marseille-Q7826]
MATLEIMQELRNWRAKEVPHHDVSCDCERCNLAKTMSLESLRGLIGNPQLDPGIYGPRGWTVLEGVTTLTLPYSDWMWFDMAREYPDVDVEEMVDYLPYSDGDAWLATQLLKVIPPNALDERQNYAPRVEDLLQLVAQHPAETFFSGYMIGPQRFDERLSIDTIFVSPHLLGLGPDDEDPHGAYAGLKRFELGEDACPDEVSVFYNRHLNRQLWRFWWD